MTPEIINSLLWRVRTRLRVDAIPLFAGHGFADPNYRPPKLPYVSVIGPLDMQRESERDPPRTLILWVQAPGYVAGAQRTAQDPLPAAGQLHLRFDGDATVSLGLDFGALANQPLDNDDTARQAAAVMQDALQQAAQNGQFRIDGVAVTDAARIEQLRAATVRWQRQRKRFVISSGRRGAIPYGQLDTHRPTQVEVLDGADNLGPALGLAEGLLTAEGRIIRHRMPNPVAVAVDVRIDLWAGTQRELAVVLDAWARITPTRGQLYLQPALLAEDLAHGATQVHLQTGGESPVRATLAQFESEGGFADRLSGRGFTLANGAVVEADALRFTGSATAGITLFEAPPIPYPWEPEHPGPTGYAVSLGLRVDAGAADGQALRVLAFEHNNRSALQLEVRYVQVNGDLLAQLRATAEQVTGQPFAPAVCHLQAAELERGAELHAVVDAAQGVLRLYHQGQPLASQPQAPAPGTPAGGRDMRLTLGHSGASPIGFRITHLQVHGRPLGPVDPLLRRTGAAAAAWSAGDPVALVRAQDGGGGSDTHFAATVVAVDQGTLSLDRPVQGDWPRGSSLVFKRSLFFAQKQLRRRDDLMNKLYRIAIEYRVSAFLEERYPGISAPLAETTVTQVRELSRVLAEAENPDNPDYPARPAQGAPGVKATVTNSI